MSIFDKFGKFMTKKIKKNPEGAKRLLAKVWKIYGYFIKKRGRDLPARNFIMSSCNNIMAKSLTSTKDTVIVSIFTPCEFFHALDMDVIFPEGMSCYMTATYCEKVFLDKADEMGIPETFCSFHKMLIGMAYMGVLPKPTCIVNTTMVCDANQLTFRLLAEIFDVPHFVIDVPNEDSPQNRKLLAEQLREMLSFVEKCTGRKMDNAKLDEIMERAQKSLSNHWEMLKLKKNHHESTKMTYHMMDAFAYHTLLGTEESYEYSKMILENVKELPLRRSGLKLLWVHVIPYWQNSMAEIFNYSDEVEIICCDMSIDHITDEPLYPGDPFEKLAANMLMDSFIGVYANRLERVLNLAKEVNADGAIYFCHWGCKQTMGAANLSKMYFEKHGLPTLVIDGDGCDPRNIQDGQMKTRMSAFIEQLECMK